MIFIGTTALAEPVRSIHLVLPAKPSPVIERIAGVFARQVTQRCEAKVVSASGGTSARVELLVQPGIGTEGFRIVDGAAGSIRIVGNDELGLLYGVGKLLRTSRYDRGGWTPGSWRGTSVPVCPIRGIYFATHFNNFYEAASAEDVERDVEDLGLWGLNSLILHFPHWQFQGFDDPAAQQSIRRLRAVMRAAKRLGLRVGLVEAANDGFKSTPPELLRTPVPDPWGRHGNFGVNLCPSNAKAHEVLIRDWSRFLDEFADVGLDFIKYWPYDEGGCGCKECWPWGAKGYPKLCRELSAVARVKAPHVRFILSTWTFDSPPAGEWAGLADCLARDKSWVDYIQADAHEDFPRYPLEKGVPGRLPLLNFPEISMWGQGPWGGYGANPLPVRLQRLWNQTEKKVSGGFPYSEGIYEDINKVICNQFYWSPDRPAVETIKEYIAFEYSPDVVGDVTAAIEILEQNHLRGHINPSADKAYELIQAAEKRLSPTARRSWRWRILAVRALIDNELFKHYGRLEGETLKKAFDELTAIYHAENAHSMPIRPPQIRIPDTKGPGLATTYAGAVSASKPVAWWRMDRFRGRILEDATGCGHEAVCETDLTLPAPVPADAGAVRPVNCAAYFSGGRMMAKVRELGETYAIELWFYNTTPNDARPITGYFFSRGPESILVRHWAIIWESAARTSSRASH